MTRRMLIVLGAALGACDSGGGGGGGTGPTGLTLTAADMPGVAPCSAQAILMDQVQLDELKAALQNGTIVHLDVPFNAADPNIFRKKCGLQGFWDPAAAVNEVAPLMTPVTIATLFQLENTGICAAGFTASSFGTGEGFPVAGTYRKEFKVAHMGMTWHLRLRVTVSGSAAGATFTSEGIAVPADLQTTLVYEVDGVVTPHDGVAAAAIAALTASTTDAPGFTLDVRESGAGQIVLTAVVEIICVQKM
jgi:hypothetical protein